MEYLVLVATLTFLFTASLYIGLRVYEMYEQRQVLRRANGFAKDLEEALLPDDSDKP